MKKFRFPLARVKDWRETQARIEESKLEALYAELRAIDSKEAALMRQKSDAERSVLSGASGEDLEALSSFRRFAVEEHTRLEKLRGDCSRRVAAQTQLVASKRRDVRLLERLREQRHQAWTRELHKELDAQADEAYLSKLSKRGRS